MHLCECSPPRPAVCLCVISICLHVCVLRLHFAAGRLCMTMQRCIHRTSFCVRNCICLTREHELFISYPYIYNSTITIFESCRQARGCTIIIIIDPEQLGTSAHAHRGRGRGKWVLYFIKMQNDIMDGVIVQMFYRPRYINDHIWLYYN